MLRSLHNLLSVSDDVDCIIGLLRERLDCMSAEVEDLFNQIKEVLES